MTAFTSLCLLGLASFIAANPLPKPTPTPPPIGPDGEEVFQQMGTCTTTLTSYIRGFTGNWSPTETTTLYRSTETVQASINCHGCGNVQVDWQLSPFYGGHGPVVLSVISVWATTPTQVTETVCATSTGTRRVGPAIPAVPILPREEPPPLIPCTSTVTTTEKPWWFMNSGDGIKTVYTSTETEFERLNCAGCALEILTEGPPIWGGLGPAVQYTATITATEAAKTTSTVCLLESAVPPAASPAAKPAAYVKRQDEDGEEKGTPAGCTFTQGVPGSWTKGPTKTIWPHTVTYTSTVDCGAQCDHVAVSTPVWWGLGPAIKFTTTITAKEPHIATAYECLAANKRPSSLISTVKPHQPLRSLPVEPKITPYLQRPKRPREPENLIEVETTRVISVEKTETVYIATYTAIHTTRCSYRQPGIPRPPPDAEANQARELGAATTIYATKTITNIRCIPTRTSSSTPAPFNPESVKKIATPLGIAAPSCTAVTMLWPDIPNSTWTVYSKTATKTSTVDCKDCALSWTTGEIYFFAPMEYTSTVTATIDATETAFACKAT